MNFETPATGGKATRRGIWAVEAERPLTDNLTWYVEGFSTEEGVKTVSTALEYKLTDHLSGFGTVGYTQDHESIFRVGLNYGF